MFLGISVHPDQFRALGIAPFLDQLAAAGITALATAPYEQMSEVITAAHVRGIQVHVVIQPTILPARDPDHMPVSIDGERVTQAGCLNHPVIWREALEMVTNTVLKFPDADGVIIDQAEYSVDQLEGHFTCFCEHCERKARALRFDWDAIKKQARATWDWMHHVTGEHLIDTAQSAAHSWGELIASQPCWEGLLRFKARTVTGFYRRVRNILTDHAPQAMRLAVKGSPFPVCQFTGTDYRALAQVCDAVIPDFTRLHYDADRLHTWNSDLSRSDLDRAAAAWLGTLPDSVAAVAEWITGEAQAQPCVQSLEPELMAAARAAVQGIWVPYQSGDQLAMLARAWQDGA